MAKVTANMSMSLDGFVSHPSDGVDQLFRWYGNGDVTVRTADPNMTFQVSEASAQRLNRGLSEIGVLVYGRRTFDDAGGWIGGHPLGRPVIVVSHSIPDGWPRADTPLTFVTDGVESAIAQARATAGGKKVVIGSADLTQQCINAGLLDELDVDLVPLLLGSGVRFLDNLREAPRALEGPTVVEGNGVTHLTYTLR
ncbi:dihydrofolate reductase family protein [Streptomyces sp. NPDC090052]|uniref:dihydrofolate reductase family protein n=1 Tax=unclassified Streptomyces TaxID=2593676 RepID=UPI00225A0795|nr:MULTISPECIES: dihydrofolate reductase family protein [unclassified Streptomyces]MCX4726725.1 dihydrofolate reductase family protein [Streptomyces sp. NBC_01306]WSV03975.1 dihydrofolate reductase family protein [Streptomyces sp. NBC_01020]WSX42036.1 dihydrofolate reductase family protein [Streptomyces sp. NBC_00963]WSX69913.1 dihydrofolate reductase family protein [Streptomyces sp. NBC_00932]